MLDFDFHSPEEEVVLPLYKAHGIRVFVKRDDLIHPYISGNKWRKLKHPLQQAKKEQKSLLVTFGGAWSNHLLATACAGAKFGFRTYGFVRGEVIENPVLKLCQIFGMELHFVDRESYRNKNVLFNTHFANSTDAFFIDEGGFGMLAAQGCAEITNEWNRSYDHCFCACGTGTTLAGLAQGIAAQQGATLLHGVPVLKGGGFIRHEIQKLGVDDPSAVQLHLDYHFGGYAKTKPELIGFIKTFTQQTSLLIEPTYTGKLFYALHDLIVKRKIERGATVLVLHTGGLTGLLGMLHKF